MKKCKHEANHTEPVMKTFEYHDDEISIIIENICNECGEVLNSEIQIFKRI